MSSSRRSRDQLRTDVDDQSRIYPCECGQEFMNEEHLRRHQQSQCQKPVTVCSFCEQAFSSSAELQTHLLLCGNKTDQCPNCRQFIRRSHFAYHYENNCAPVEQVETPPRPRKRAALHPLTNSDRPISREDIPNIDYPDQHSSTYSPRTNGRRQSSGSTPRSSPGRTECEFCHNQCAQADYKAHRNKCLRNPANNNNRPAQSRTISGSKESNSNGIAHIPCEICGELVDVPNWSRHMQTCREEEKQRIAMRARAMSHEPVTEQLPCEYCQESYPAARLQAHQIRCPNNPENAESAARIARPRAENFHSLPTRSQTGRRGGRPANNIRDVQYQSIDHARTHEANREFDDGRPDQNPIQPNEYRSYETLPRMNRSRTPIDGTTKRERSSFENLQNIRDDYDRNDRAYDNRSRQRSRSGHGTLEVINNQEDRRSEKKRKVPWWQKLLTCGFGGGHPKD